MCCREQVRSLRYFENFRAEQRGWSATPILLTKFYSCPFEESHQLMNLWVCYPPLGPVLLLAPWRSLLWHRPTPAAVSLWTQHVGRGIPNLQLVIELVQAMGQVMHSAGAQWTTLSPWWAHWVLGPFCSHTDSSSERQGRDSGTLIHVITAGCFLDSCLQIDHRWNISQDNMVGVLPGMWQQVVPDFFCSDKVLRVCRLLHWDTVKVSSQSVLQP